MPEKKARKRIKRDEIKIMSPAEFIENTSKVYGGIIRKLEKLISDNLRGLSNYTIFNLVYYTSYDTHCCRIFNELLNKIIKKYTDVGWFALLSYRIINSHDDEDQFEKHKSSVNTYYLCKDKGFKYSSLSKYKLELDYEPIKIIEEEEDYTYIKFPKAQYINVPLEERCMICIDAKPAILYSCGHRNICEKCDSLDKCPMCRRNITARYKIEEPQ